MANAQLRVEVNNGTTPLDINVAIFKDNEKIDSFSKPNSFTKKWSNLNTGVYKIFIHGFNPAGGFTNFDLTGESITINKPATIPFTKKGVGYMADFKFTV
jgi:hypothetical protein